MGQRDINWVRISKEAQAKGFKFRHFGSILHAKFHAEFGKIFDFLELPYEETVTELFRSGKKLNSSFSEKERHKLRWQNSWSEEQKAAFVSICGQLLVGLGYEKDDSWAESCLLPTAQQT